MAAMPTSSPDPAGPPNMPGEADGEPADPRFAFRSALARYQAARLASIVQLRNLESDAVRSTTLAADLTAQLDSTSNLNDILAGVSCGAPPGPQPVRAHRDVGLAAYRLDLCAGNPGRGTQVARSRASRTGLACSRRRGAIPSPSMISTLGSTTCPRRSLLLRVHPAVPQAVRVSRPDGKLTPVAGSVGQIRESDGLEPVLRLAAIWQRVGVEPLRQTGQGALYKRDLERIEEDAVLSGAISDALEPLAAMSLLWLALARRVGLILHEAAGDRLGGG